MSDSDWQALAVDTRDALALLGHPIGPRCLPGETAPCGGSHRQHAIAHLATIRAIADHQAAHATSSPEDYLRVYREVRQDLEYTCPNPPPCSPHLAKGPDPS